MATKRRATKKAAAPKARNLDTWSATHSIRFGDTTWDELTAKAKPQGGNSTVIRRLVTLYLTNPMVAQAVENTPDEVTDRARKVVDPATDMRLAANHPGGQTRNRTR